MNLFYGLTQKRLEMVWYALHGDTPIHDHWEPWHNTYQLAHLVGTLAISVKWEFDTPEIYYSRVTATSGVHKVVVEGSGRDFPEIYLEAVLGIAADIGETIFELAEIIDDKGL